MISQTRNCTVLTNATADNGVAVFWRDDIDSLAFRPNGHEGLCVMHRRAFRVLFGKDPAPQECFDYFLARRPAFERAAQDKIASAALPANAHFHLNSRDIRAAL